MDQQATMPSDPKDLGSIGVTSRSRNTQRVQRFRERRPRIDFYPSPDVLAILLHHRKSGPDPTFAGILDGLVRLGHRALGISGNGKN
jgi:hypothetical protein